MASIFFLHYPDLPGIGRRIETAADYLAAQGHQTLVFTEGTQAEKRLITEAPDILVSTLFIPPKDVFHMTSALWEHHPGNQTGVVLM